MGAFDETRNARPDEDIETSSRNAITAALADAQMPVEGEAQAGAEKPEGEAQAAAEKPEGDAQAAAQKPEGEAQAGAEKPEGEEEDPHELPEDLKQPGREKSAQRFQFLANGKRTAEKERDEARAQIEELQGLLDWGAPHLRRTEAMDAIFDAMGASEGQLVEVARALQAYNSGDPVGMRAARAFLAEATTALDAALGDTAEGSPDPVARFPDLLEAVENAEITAERAEEMALLRIQAGQLQGEIGDQAHQQAVAHYQMRDARAMSEITNVDARLWDTDPTYRLYRPVLAQSLVALRENGVPPEHLLPTLARQFEVMRATGAPGLPPAGQGAAPAGQGAAPAGQGAAPAGQGAAPAGQGAAPGANLNFLRPNQGMGTPAADPHPAPRDVNEAIRIALQEANLA